LHYTLHRKRSAITLAFFVFTVIPAMVFYRQFFGAAADGVARLICWR